MKEDKPIHKLSREEGNFCMLCGRSLDDEGYCGWGCDSVKKDSVR